MNRRDFLMAGAGVVSTGVVRAQQPRRAVRPVPRVVPSQRVLLKGGTVLSLDPKIGDFDSELVETFWQALAANALMNLHLVLHYGTNSHHVAEALFKATARALREAVSIDPTETGVPSTKGTLTA